MAYTRYYIYKKQISLDGGVTWNDLYPSEIVPSGTPIGTYDTLLECEGTEMYRWVKTDDVSCKEIPTLEEILYGKYYIYKRQVSYDSGSTWNDTGYAVTSGDPIALYDTEMHCERDAIYRWEYRDMCINLDKYSIKVKQFSLDSGATWEDESPSKNEYLYIGTYNATSCGYNNPYEDGIGKCFYNYGTCDGSSSYICFHDYNENLGSMHYYYRNGSGSFYSKMNLSMPSTGYNICAVAGYGMGIVKSAGNLNLTQLDGKAVKEVSGSTKISIGYGVTSIGNYSFMFGNLEELVIPNTISSIADGAFFGSSYLKRVVMLGTTPPEIGENTFPHSDILTIYVPPESVNKYKSASGWTSYSDYIVGYGSQKTPLSTYKVKITDVFGYDYYISCDGNSTLTSGNTNIYVYNGDNSDTSYLPFIDSKTKIKEIEVGSCVTTLGAYSIGSEGEGCTSGYLTFSNVTKVTVPNSVTTIDERAFQNSTMLTNITIPNSVTSIGDKAFMNCCYLSGITIPSSVTSIGENVFYGCGNLSAITIPSTTTVIGKNAFGITPWWNSYSADVSHQYGNIIYINNVAYVATSNAITSCQFKDTTVSISPSAFYNCSNLLGGIVIPSSVNYIGEYAFWHCDSITSVTISSGVNTIADSTFEGCYSLANVDIPNSVTSIGNNAFSACNLSNLTIPNSVTNIGAGAFHANTGLTELTIPDSVTSIGGGAFSYCYSITSITIGSGVTSINNDAFAQCYGLWNLTIYATTPPTLGEDVFWDIRNYFLIYVPSGSVSAYESAWSALASRIRPINY